MKSLTSISLLFAIAAILPMHGTADTITFATPTGSTTSGGAVDAQAVVVTGAGTVTVTLSDLQMNPTDVAQLVSDFEFTLSNNNAMSGTIASSSGQEVSISSHSATLGSTVATGWGLNNLGAGSFQLDALGYVGPQHLIIGPGPYTNANGSIDGNNAHNPFLNQSATFTLDIAGVTSSTDVSNAVFSFGTTGGINVDGSIPNTPPVPEPSSLLLLGSGFAAVAGALKFRFLTAA